MILVAAIAVLAAAMTILVCGLFELHRDRRDAIAEKADWWRRLEEREAALDAREERMVTLHRGLIEDQAAERRELLDRIQAPGMVAARLLPDAVTEDAQAGASDEDVDKAFQERPEAAVKWDADLAPLPWDLTASDDVPQPTVEPVRP